jgi:hypothetical protein
VITPRPLRYSIVIANNKLSHRRPLPNAARQEYVAGHNKTKVVNVNITFRRGS